MRALGSFVVIKKEVEEVKSQSGLIMTEFTDKSIRYKLGEIISVGEDVFGLDKGDKVYYDSAAGSEIRIEGEKMIVVPDRQVVVKL
jgi:co-chaperonin GroES (HSP10)